MYSKFKALRSTMCETREVSLSVPVDLVKKTIGLSIDIGGSMLKFVYRSKDNQQEANNTTEKLGHLQLVAFPKPDLQLALQYVKERCVITRGEGEDPPEIYTTGLGCTVSGKTICENFNVRLKNITEFDCFVKSFTYLAACLPRKDFVHPFDDAATKESIEMMKAQLTALLYCKDEEGSDSLKSMKTDVDFTECLGKVVNDSDFPMAEAEDIYPCILAMCGSGFGYMLIKSDKTFVVADGSNRGGRSFYGIGSLLTGCKNYEELIELATHGDNKNVDVYSDALFSIENATDGDNSIYAQAAKISCPSLVYCFGKAVHYKPESFRREDLARAWLKYICNDTVQCLHLLSRLHRVKHLFFCGSFCNSPLVRSVITAEMVTRNLFSSTAGAQPVKIDFVKPGPHLGALGAIIN